MVFKDLVQVLHHLFTALFGQRWNRNADDLAIVLRVESTVAGADGFLTVRKDAGIEWLNCEQLRFRRVYLSDLIERHLRAIRHDLHSVEHVDGSAPRARGGERV